jgi:DNA-binding NarL/FixJ family response regulator
MDGIELIALMHEAWPTLACVVLSAHRAAVYSGRAQAAGARGYVEKGNLGVLVDVLRDVGAGRPTWAPQDGGRSGGNVG